MTVTTPPVLAAGAVCWRLVGGSARILVVHRATHNDVSLPKGKVDPGELLPQTAQREILEETGLSVTLGPPLGTVEYPLPSGRVASGPSQVPGVTALPWRTAMIANVRARPAASRVSKRSMTSRSCS